MVLVEDSDQGVQQPESYYTSPQKDKRIDVFIDDSTRPGVAATERMPAVLRIQKSAIETASSFEFGLEELD